MKRKLTLENVLFLWFFFNLAMLFLNGATVRSTLLAQAVSASLGMFLLCVPVYPTAWETYYGAARARTYIQIAAAVQIALSFLICIRF